MSNKKKNLINEYLINNKDLPQHDHGDGCSGTGYHIHNNQFAYNTHSSARRDAPGTIRRRRRRRQSAPIATSILQISPPNNETQVTSKTLIKPPHIFKTNKNEQENKK